MAIYGVNETHPRSRPRRHSRHQNTENPRIPPDHAANVANRRRIASREENLLPRRHLWVPPPQQYRRLHPQDIPNINPSQPGPRRQQHVQFFYPRAREQRQPAAMEEQDQQQNQNNAIPAGRVTYSPDHPGREQTTICKFYLKGRCNRFPNCSFAHGNHDLRVAQYPFCVDYKSKVCEYFARDEFCPHGYGCWFGHGEKPGSECRLFKNTRQCYFMDGGCPFIH